MPNLNFAELIENIKNFACWMPSKPQIPDCTGISFTNIIYIKLSTFPSREIFGLCIGRRF